MQLTKQEEERADAAWARVAVLEGIIHESASELAATATPVPVPRQWGEEKAMSESGSSDASGTTEEEHAHRVAQQQLQPHDPCVLAMSDTAKYQRVVESSQEGLLLLRATNVGPVVAFSNVAAACLLKAAQGGVHR